MEMIAMSPSAGTGVSKRRSRDRDRAGGRGGAFAEDRFGDRRDRGVVEDEGGLQGPAEPLGQIRRQRHQLS
nr:hypothetical protein [Streptomyces sp. RPA4-2]